MLSRSAFLMVHNVAGWASDTFNQASYVPILEPATDIRKAAPVKHPNYKQSPIKYHHVPEEIRNWNTSVRICLLNNFDGT